MEPFTTQADLAASPAPILDALTGAEAAGVVLESDGHSAHIVGDYRKVPRSVRDAVRQSKHQLARLLGNTRREGRAP